MASYCYLLVEHRIRIAGGLPLGVILSALVLQIPINLLPMGEIEGNGAVDLLQREHREGLGNRLSGLPCPPGIDDESSETRVPVIR